MSPRIVDIVTRRYHDNGIVDARFGVDERAAQLLVQTYNAFSDANGLDTYQRAETPKRIAGPVSAP